MTPDITWKSWAMVGILGLTWGGTFLVTELALEEFPPFWLAAGRITFAALVMSAVWQGMVGGRLFASPPPPSAIVAVLSIGAFSTAIPFTLLAWGQQFVTSGLAGVSMASVGLIVLPLAHFFVPGEAMTLRRSLGFLIGFAGVCLLLGSQAFDTIGAALEWAGRLACISAACCYGISSVLMRRLPSIDPIGLATILLIIAACMVIPLALLREGAPPLPTAKGLMILAFLGLIPTAAASLLRVLVIRSAGPVFMSLTNFQVPVWSLVLGAVLLNEPLPGTLVIALALILAGSGLSQYGALSRMFRARA
ncbi:DMT family transporter [Aliishimia ponticola]|uniref:DMT family transporter n=1 Tax=Aliishimia ponticola TaxID=2499833 RepID=A0A4S4NFM4_9RHOB|nr:DMT family transporter [Aliishimia ponticola]THH37407.1 DMT family transporter [Aliishimia ponticola]